MKIHFAKDQEDLPPDIVIRHQLGLTTVPGIQRIDLGSFDFGDMVSPREIFADLRWAIGNTKVFSGSLQSSGPRDLRVSTFNM